MLLIFFSTCLNFGTQFTSIGKKTFKTHFNYEDN